MDVLALRRNSYLKIKRRETYFLTTYSKMKENQPSIFSFRRPHYVDYCT